MIEQFDLARLPRNWTVEIEITRQLGMEWLRSARSALLRVPSALVPETFNVLLNPLHGQAGVLEIRAAYDYPFDPRIKK